MTFLLFSARVVVTVDRIEPPMAVLEWPSGVLTDVPLLQLPADLEEGDTLRLAMARPRFQPPGRAARHAQGATHTCHENKPRARLMR